MLFELDELHLQLLEVLYLEEEAVVMRTRARPFYALSLRQSGDTGILLMDGTQVHLGERDLALFHPNTAYTRRSQHDRRYVFHFSLQNQVYVPDKAPKIEILRDFRYDTLLPLFTEACRIWNAGEAGYHIRCTALLYTVFAEIREHLHPNRQEYSPIVAEAMRELQTHYCDPELSVSVLADRLHISTAYLRSCFGRELETTPKAYLNSLRMYRAQTLLNTGYYTVSGVAEQVGFSDAKNFTTAYRKYFGYPPSAQKYDDFRQGRDENPFSADADRKKQENPDGLQKKKEDI